MTLGCLGLAGLVLTVGLVLRVGSNDDGTIDVATSTPSSHESLRPDPGEQRIDGGLGDQLVEIAPVEVPGLDQAPVTLPVPTIPLPNFATTVTTAAPLTPAPLTPAPSASAPNGAARPTFSEKGVWVVRADGSSPVLVAKQAAAGVAVGGAWVVFMDGDTVKAAKRTDLTAIAVLATGVGGSAAQGLPISGGQRGVAFVRGTQVTLLDPAKPGQPLEAFEAPGVDAVAAEEDGEGRLVWADLNGIHLGKPENVRESEEVERGMLEVGHGFIAHLETGLVTLRDGPRLTWGEIDRIHTGPAGLVAGSGGRIRFRTASGEERLLVAQATLPLVTATRLIYVSEGKNLATSSLTGTAPRVVGTASPGLAITGLDLMDDSTLVVTVS